MGAAAAAGQWLYDPPLDAHAVATGLDRGKARTCALSTWGRTPRVITSTIPTIVVVNSALTPDVRACSLRRPPRTASAAGLTDVKVVVDGVPVTVEFAESIGANGYAAGAGAAVDAVNRVLARRSGRKHVRRDGSYTWHPPMPPGRRAAGLAAGRTGIEVIVTPDRRAPS